MLQVNLFSNNSSTVWLKKISRKCAIDFLLKSIETALCFRRHMYYVTSVHFYNCSISGRSVVTGSMVIQGINVPANMNKCIYVVFTNRLDVLCSSWHVCWSKASGSSAANHERAGLLNSTAHVPLFMTSLHHWESITFISHYTETIWKIFYKSNIRIFTSVY